MAQSKPLLTVVLTTYNRPHLIIHALQSVVDCDDVKEILVVDDFTADLPDEWASSIERIDSRIRVIQLAQNGGVSIARNQGWQAAKGSHVLFLDDDDRLFPRGLRRLWKHVLRSPSFVHVGMLHTEVGGVKTGRRWPASARAGQIWGLDHPGPFRKFLSWDVKQSAIIPIDLLHEIGGFDVNFQSRVWTEIFFRISEISAIRGHFVPVDQLNRDPIDRITAHTCLRQEHFEKLIAKHCALLEARHERRVLLEANHNKMMARK